MAACSALGLIPSSRAARETRGLRFPKGRFGRLLPSSAMSLEVEGISLALRRGEEVRTLLEPLSFRLDPGDVLGLTGPSGAGKTTLLRIIVGLEGRSSGEILLDGKPLEAVGLPRFRRQVQLVPQRLSMGTTTARAFLGELRSFREAEGRPEEPRVLEEMEALALNEKHLDQPFTALSGGESRRMVLALALAREPRYLLLDEPTAGLDGASREKVLRRLDRAAAGGTGVLLATHEETVMARLAREVLILYDGALQGRGPTSEILAAAWQEVHRERPA